MLTAFPVTTVGCPWLLLPLSAPPDLLKEVRQKEKNVLLARNTRRKESEQQTQTMLTRIYS